MPLHNDSRVVLQKFGDVLVVPIPDPLKLAFLEELSGKLLVSLQRQAVTGVVLDLSGVEILDLDDFHGLRKISQVADLMGSPVALAGIRPGVAAGLTALGVDSSWARPAMSVELALEALK